MKPINLYFWPTPNGWKITLMLEECEIPYEIIYVDLSKREQFTADFLKISPNGRMPAIIDPNGPNNIPISIFESGAILQYLGNKTGKFYPKNQRERTDVDQWLFWQMAGLGPMAGQAAHFRNYKSEKIEYAVKRYTDEVIRLYGVMDKHLANRKYLAETFSIADMACWPWIRGYKAYGINLTDFTNLRTWFKRIGARPRVERAANIGKDYFRQQQKNAQNSI